jgi:hypothetical protein
METGLLEAQAATAERSRLPEGLGEDETNQDNLVPGARKRRPCHDGCLRQLNQIGQHSFENEIEELKMVRATNLFELDMVEKAGQGAVFA